MISAMGWRCAEVDSTANSLQISISVIRSILEIGARQLHIGYWECQIICINRFWLAQMGGVSEQEPLQ
jgi:hypothetical protein